ncbi:YlbF family regulator [Metabacillus sp. KIGAM252]|uniref:YlbF family regulator n=1 Tax=Metabacillus flavus TaxID=2823519 RepID=A0ABS5LE24_9BACI|nr:YlbF family regulator [Metabacillus flavus]MBS2968849.1 YlbF family regulator [Metabacillus flavus]
MVKWSVEVLSLVYATMESVQILEQADQISEMILKSDLAEAYRMRLEDLKKDQTAQEIVSRFVKVKDIYEDVQRFGKYHPDYRKISKDMREIKRELDLNEKVAAFRRAETELQTLLDEISIQLGSAVSEHVKVPTGNPFFDSLSSCGGGCGSGGGCGCKVS